MKDAKVFRIQLNDCPTEFCLELILNVVPQKSLFFSTKNENALNSWIEAIKMAANLYNMQKDTKKSILEAPDSISSAFQFFFQVINTYFPEKHTKFRKTIKLNSNWFYQN